MESMRCNKEEGGEEEEEGYRDECHGAHPIRHLYPTRVSGCRIGLVYRKPENASPTKYQIGIRNDDLNVCWKSHLHPKV